MTVILVLLTFAIFLAIDYVLSLRKGEAPSLQHAETTAPEAVSVPNVSGIPIPADLRYHPGHTWLARERKNVLRVGADAFAVLVSGPVEAVELPKPGHWVRQGQKAVTLRRGGEVIEMVSPVEGEITAINSEVVADPSLLKSDPYGQGWLFRVFSPDEVGPARNLLPANLVRSWMRNSLDRFLEMQPRLAGATAAEGGPPVANPHKALPALPGKRISEEFFLI
jgi:glycine cleavage system H protein